MEWCWDAGRGPRCCAVKIIGGLVFTRRISPWCTCLFGPTGCAAAGRVSPGRYLTVIYAKMVVRAQWYDYLFTYFVLWSILSMFSWLLIQSEWKRVAGCKWYYCMSENLAQEPDMTQHVFPSKVHLCVALRSHLGSRCHDASVPPIRGVHQRCARRVARRIQEQRRLAGGPSTSLSPLSPATTTYPVIDC